MKIMNMRAGSLKNDNSYYMKGLALMLFFSFALPLDIVSAQGQNSFGTLLESLQGIINQLIPLVASLALLAFFWGLAKYVFQAADEGAQESGKKIMIAGIVALFLIASVGGIVQFLANAFGLSTGSNISPPTINLDSTTFESMEIVYNIGDGIG